MKNLWSQCIGPVCDISLSLHESDVSDRMIGGELLRLKSQSDEQFVHFFFVYIFCDMCRSMAVFLQPSPHVVQPCRTRIIYGRLDGEPETVQDVVDRFYRLENGLWIRPRAGRGKKLWKKLLRRQFGRINRLKQHVICNKTQCRMLDQMVNIEYKTPKYYVGDPYTVYHRKSNLPDYRYRPPKFLP